jgi:aminoglycoside phosphotransferase (APT) family kinase protein
MTDRLGRPVEIDDVAALSTGFSAETLRIDTPTGPYVLRRESPEPAVYPEQAKGHDVEVDIQYRLMSALSAGTSIPLAPLIGYESSTGIVGAPFYVMGFVEGQVPLVTPTYAAEGFFADGTADQRREMVTDGIRVLAELHTLDWEKHDLGWLLPDGAEPTAMHQVDVWRAYLERELRGRAHPLVTGAFDWLATNAPEHDPSSVTVNWGDPRLGNIIWQEYRAACVTDFEAACIAPYAVDLGWWLMFDRWSHEHSHAPARLEGEPTREEQAAIYFDLAGRTPVDTLWYEIFAAVRYSAIVVRVINRTVDRGLMPAENDYWRKNQATHCLEDLLP